MNRKTLVPLFGLIVVAVAVFATGNYATGTAAGDTAGGILGWIRSMIQKAKNTFGGLTGGNSAMDIALQLIRGFEGFSSKAYPDAGGYSIGYGHHIVSGDGFTQDSEISESDASALLEQDASASLDCVEQSVTSDMTPQQEGALISLCYNIGCGAFRSSTLLRNMNAGDYQGAAEQFAVWIHSSGAVNENLVSRREQEQAVFLEGTATDGTSANNQSA